MAQNTPMVDLAGDVVHTPSPALDMKHLGLVEIERWSQSDFDRLLRYRAVGVVCVLGHMYSTES